MENDRSLYLDLVKRCVLNVIYADYAYSEKNKFIFQKILLPVFFKKRAKVVVPFEDDENMRLEGRMWSPMSQTMIGMKRLDNIQFCVEQVIKENVPGDLMETGVWRGGATIFMRAVLKAYGVTDRKVWVVDSFEGLPKPDAERYPADQRDEHHMHGALAVSLEDVKENFRKYNLLDEQVGFLKGWFKDTLPSAPAEKLAVLRLDGDMYGSTMDVLTNVYHKLSVGGYLIVDDYEAVPACKMAVQDFKRKGTYNRGVERASQAQSCGNFQCSCLELISGPR